MHLSELKKLKLIKKSADFSTFTAVVMEPNAVDAHGDIASAETVKKAAHDYIKNQKMVCGVNHEEVTQDIALVESYLLKNDTDFDGQVINKGAWIGEFEVNSSEKKEQIFHLKLMTSLVNKIKFLLPVVENYTYQFLLNQ